MTKQQDYDTFMITARDKLATIDATTSRIDIPVEILDQDMIMTLNALQDTIGAYVNKLKSITNPDDIYTEITNFLDRCEDDIFERCNADLYDVATYGSVVSLHVHLKEIQTDLNALMAKIETYIDTNNANINKVESHEKAVDEGHRQVPR